MVLDRVKSWARDAGGSSLRQWPGAPGETSWLWCVENDVATCHIQPDKSNQKTPSDLSKRTFSSEVPSVYPFWHLERAGQIAWEWIIEHDEESLSATLWKIQLSVSGEEVEAGDDGY